MKTRYRLHCQIGGPLQFWTCDVTFIGLNKIIGAGSRWEQITLHSGPCATPGSAIGEAWGLWRKHGIH